MRIGDSVDRSCTTPLCRLRSKTAIGNESRRSDPQSWSDSSSDGADNSGFRDQQTRNVGQSRTDKRRRSAYNSASCRSTIRTSHAARPRERYAALRPEPRIRARGSLRSNSTSEVNRRLGSTAATIATHRARIGGGLGTRQDAACAVQRPANASRPICSTRTPPSGLHGRKRIIALRGFMQLPSNEQRENCRSLGDLVLMRIVSCLVAARYASDQAGGFSLAIEALPLESASPSRPCPLARSRSAGDPHADAAPAGRGRCRKAIDA